MLMIVRAVPERAECLEYLRSRLPADTVYLVDHAGDGARANFHNALMVAGSRPCLHMEDDIVLTRHFVPKVEAVLAQHANDVVQFFSMRKADLESGSRWDRGGAFSMNQCFYLPAGMGPKLLAFYPNWSGRVVHRSANDIFIADYLKQTRTRYWIHVPSLVQHRSLPSAIDHRRSRNRKSMTFVDGDK